MTRMSTLFPNSPTIDKISPDGNAWCWVHVSAKRTVRLHTRTVADLDLKAGTPWTTELAATADDASRVDHAVSGIRKWLHARPRTRAEAAERLASTGLPSPLANRALDRLVASGEINDSHVAEIERRAAERRGSSPEAFTSRMQDRGIDPSAAAQPEPVSAVDVASKRADSFAPGLAWPLKARRLLAWLASRGFSEEESEAAVRTVLGPPPESDQPGTLDL